MSVNVLDKRPDNLPIYLDDSSTHGYTETAYTSIYSSLYKSQYCNRKKTTFVSMCIGAVQVINDVPHSLQLSHHHKKLDSTWALFPLSTYSQMIPGTVSFHAPEDSIIYVSSAQNINGLLLDSIRVPVIQPSFDRDASQLFYLHVESIEGLPGRI